MLTGNMQRLELEINCTTQNKRDKNVPRIIVNVTDVLPLSLLVSARVCVRSSGGFETTF